MEINKMIKLKAIKSSDEINGNKILRWSYNGYEFEYVNGDSKLDIKNLDGHWLPLSLNGANNKTTAIKTIKEYLTIKEA